jgi:glycerol kinase
MTKSAGIRLQEVRVDGGPTKNKFLMQFQADMLQAPIVRSEVEDASAFGALVMNGFALGKWASFEEAEAVWAASEPIKPVHAEEEMAAQYEGWHKAIGMLMNS